MRAFADLNVSARLQLVWDRLIAGQTECSLRRHLNSVWPSTPIRDIVDRCRVRESHAKDTDSWGACPSTERPQSVAVRKDVRLSCSDLEVSDDDVLSVGDVWPLATAAPLAGAGLIDDCQPHVDLNDDILSVGTWTQMKRPMMCCERLDDFDWVVSDYDPDRLLSGPDIEIGITDLTWDIQILSHVFPVMFDEMAAVPMCLPVVVETGPQVDYDPDILLSGRDVEVGVTDVSDCPADLLHSKSDGCFVASARGAAVPTSLPTISELIFSAVLARGVAEAAPPPPPLAVVGTVTARVSVLPDV